MTEVVTKTVVVYTDGACSGNPGIGGWGAILRYGEKSREIYGGDSNTTNNQMELRAAIEALKALKYSCRVELYTDSQYIKRGICEWIGNWETNGWKNSKKQTVANLELWQELNGLTKAHSISWFWVKGHGGNEMNNLADKLAKRWIEENRSSLDNRADPENNH
ncbi:MAG: ribonuclease HI [Rickettsiales bacterium]|jgi:ribonuclease HI|nr:ribonuclease HI [Rickettsiales bacterium]